MALNTQKDAFLRYEADNWFMRNSAGHYVPEEDIVIKVLKEYDVKPHNILEIGCSSGYRLNALRHNFQVVNVTGIEPSQEAIKEGQKNYPGVTFLRGTADEMSDLKPASFDLVIIGFVLYVIDREILLKVIAETDRVLKDGGILQIIDFFSEKPTRNAYHHIKEIEAFAFKQNYEDIFVSTRLYHLLDKRSMSHAGKGYDLTGDYYNKYSLTTLRKDLSAGYK